MSEWAAICEEGERAVLGELVRSVDAAATVEFAATADSLRRMVFEAAPGELGAVVGPVSSGVSGVNLAAAVAHDGNARCVVLARRGVTGSLRSRAARAGVDLVVDLSEVPMGAGSPRGADGGPLRAAGPAPRPMPAPSPVAAPPRRVAAPTGDAAGRAPVIVFCSGRGGVGKTSLVATCAALAASWGMGTCAVDLDLSCGNLYACLGLREGVDLARLAAPGDAACDPTDLLGAPAPAGVRVLGPCALPEDAELAMPRAGELLAAAAAACDVVLVDTSATFTDAVAQAVQLADRVVLVSDGRPGATASTARMAGLAVRLGVERTRLVRLENRASPRARGARPLGAAEPGLEATRTFRVLDGGDEVEDLVAAGEVAELAGSGSPFAASAAAMLAQLLSELGRLPDCEEARAAAEGAGGRGRRPLLGLRWGAR